MAVVIDNRNGKSTAVSKFHPAPPEDRRRDVGRGLPPSAQTEVRDKSRALSPLPSIPKTGPVFHRNSLSQRLSQDYSADEDKVSEAIRRAGAGGIATSRSRCASPLCKPALALQFFKFADARARNYHASGANKITYINDCSISPSSSQALLV